MNPDELTLPEAGPASFVSQLQYHPEWRIDPAFLFRIDKIAAIRVAAVRMRHLGKQAALQAQILSSQEAMYNEIAEVLTRQTG